MLTGLNLMSRTHCTPEPSRLPSVLQYGCDFRPEILVRYSRFFLRLIPKGTMARGTNARFLDCARARNPFVSAAVTPKSHDRYRHASHVASLRQRRIVAQKLD